MAALGLPFLFYHNRHDYTSTFFSMDTVVSVKSDKNITEQIKTEITALDEILDCCSETSEISELNKKKEKICSSELTDFILQSEELSRTYGYGVDISAGELTGLWRDSLEKKVLPEGDKIAELLNQNGKQNISVSGDKVTLEMSPYDLTKGRIIWRDK